MALFDRDRFHKVVPADLTGFGRVSGIKELDDGSLWLCEERGVIHIAASEVRKFLESTSYGVHYEVFDSRDGLPGKFQFSKNAGPNVIEGSDGRLWFTGGHGLAWLNPAAFSSNVLPPISISYFTADGKRFALQPDPTLPSRSQNLHIKYTALNLSSPEQVRYRYKLDGVDKDWQDASVRREAFYNNLGPGKYKFHITARNEGGEWNAEEAILDFRIAPAWFQTIWFRSFCVCVFLFLLWMLYQLRLKQMERQFNRTLEARVAERTRIARELHDTLLQTFSASLLRFQSVSKMLPTRPDEAKQRVDSAIEQASSAIAEGRDAVHELRSGGLSTADLAESIHNFVKELVSSSAGESSPEIRVQVEGTPRNLDPMVRDETYRIAAEALRNAVRYAGARRIEVDIRYDEGQLRLRIRDDGKGIDPGVLEQGHASGRWGLRGMRERAKLLGGNFEVWSEAGSGTEIELTIPAAKAYSKPASRWSVFLKGWRN
jgi:signal transduction histidine kinase